MVLCFQNINFGFFFNKCTCETNRDDDNISDFAQCIMGNIVYSACKLDGWG